MSNALSTVSALKGSFSTKSKFCVCDVTLRITTVSPVAGILPEVNVTLPPEALPPLPPRPDIFLPLLTTNNILEPF